MQREWSKNRWVAYPDSQLVDQTQACLALSYYYQGETDQAWLAVQTLLDDHLDSEYKNTAAQIIASVTYSRGTQ